MVTIKQEVRLVEFDQNPVDNGILTRLGLDGTNSCPGSRGVNPKNIKFLIAIFVSLGLVVFLSKQMMTCSQCRTSSAYSKRETKASLLPLHSCWLDTPAEKKEIIIST